MPRVSPCEPLCARFWAGVALCTRRGNIQPARGKSRDGIKTANKPPRPAGVQRFNGMKRTPRVVIPPHRNVGIALCEGRKNPLKASRRNILFLCCRWQIPPRILLFPIGAEISFYGSFYHLRWRWPASHLSGLRQSRCPAKCTGRGVAPHPQAAGRSPHPPSCERFCGNAFTRLRRRSFKGGPVPL